MDNNIQLIDQRIAHLCSLIPICKAQSAVFEKRLSNEIIALEIKRIKAIHAIQQRLGKLRALIPVYKARHHTYEHVLAKQIINLDIQHIAAKTNQFLPHHPSLHPAASQPLAPHHPAPQPPTPQPKQLNDMARIFTQRIRQIPNLYGQPGQPIGAPVSNF